MMGNEKTPDPVKVKYRNDTGGAINIPELAAGSQLEGAVKSWKKVEAGKIFDVLCVAGSPVNPSLRVLSEAKSNGICLASEPEPKTVTRRGVGKIR